MTIFSRILHDAVTTIPGAVGGAFAAADGEMVDSYATVDAYEWALLTAHYGVVMANMQAAFGTWHFGSVQYFVAQHDKYDVLVCDVALGYYALVVMRPPAPVGLALQTLRNSVAALRKEIC